MSCDKIDWLAHVDLVPVDVFAKLLGIIRFLRHQYSDLADRSITVMRYRIIGQDPDTGTSIDLIVDAPSAQKAQAIAEARKIKVQRIEPEPDAPPPPTSLTESKTDADDDNDKKEPVLVRIEPGYVQTIERTGKNWKALLLLGSLLLLGGLTSCGWAMLSDPRALTSPPLLAWIGGSIALTGFVIFLFGRFGAWWFHG